MVAVAVVGAVELRVVVVHLLQPSNAMEGTHIERFVVVKY